MAPLNLFYEEPDPDRWLPFDRFPRRVVRRVVRGKPQPGGQTRVFMNLCAGLDRLGVPYRVNDYRHVRRHPDELACIVGKPQVLDRVEWKNPILFGAAVFSHPSDDPELMNRLPIRRVLVPGEWVRTMFADHYGNVVHAWPVGIDTDTWSPEPASAKDIDVLLYDKVRWEHDRFERELISPIRERLARGGLRVAEIRYGFYREEEFRRVVKRSRSMVFLCEHESQGIAYQQVLASNVPILAWDHGGEWRDPSYHPHRALFAPVSSVPYWDDRCGARFSIGAEFPEAFERFWSEVLRESFAPRDFILDHLTLESCATRYLEHVDAARMT